MSEIAGVQSLLASASASVLQAIDPRRLHAPRPHTVPVPTDVPSLFHAQALNVNHPTGTGFSSASASLRTTGTGIHPLPLPLPYPMPPPPRNRSASGSASGTGATAGGGGASTGATGATMPLVVSALASALASASARPPRVALRHIPKPRPHLPDPILQAELSTSYRSLAWPPIPQRWQDTHPSARAVTVSPSANAPCKGVAAGFATITIPPMPVPVPLVSFSASASTTGLAQLPGTGTVRGSPGSQAVAGTPSASGGHVASGSSVARSLTLAVPVPVAGRKHQM